MSITSYSQSRMNGTTLVSVASDLAGVVYFHWYVDGNYRGPTTSDDGTSSRSFLLQAGQQNRVEVLDTTDPDFDPIANEPESYPGSRTIAFIRSVDPVVSFYRIDEFTGHGWSPLFSIPSDPGKWEYRVVITGLADLTAYRWRVTVVDAYGNDGDSLEVNGGNADSVVRWPDAPDFSLSFDTGTTQVTFSPLVPAYAAADAVHLESGSGIDIASMRWIGTLNGVSVLAVSMRNGPGTGIISAAGTDGDGNPLLSWQAPGSSTAGRTTADSMLVDGEDASKFVLVSSEAGYVPEFGSAFVHITDSYDIGSFGDITAAQALAGNVAAGALKLKNHSVLPVQNVKLWIADGESGSDALDVSLDGITWVHPIAEDDAAVLSWPIIASGATADVYVRRTIAAGAASSPRVLNHLEFRWDGV